MDSFELDRNIADLIEVQNAAITRDDGTITRAAVPPLLAQLRAAAANSSTAAPGGGSSEKTKIPVNAAAVDLWAAVLRGAEDLAARYAVRGERAPSGPVECIKWAHHGIRARKLQHEADDAAKITGQWIAAIRELMDPARKVPLAGACPACGLSTLSSFKDGDLVRAPVVHVHRKDGPGTFARCDYCGAEWPAVELLDLAAAMGLPGADLLEAARGGAA